MALGIYIHIPFCAAKCKYCDFNSHVSNAEERKSYIMALCDEIRAFENDDMSVDTIYFGGGTPTLLEASQLAKVLDAVRLHFDVLPDCEITTECNPATMRRDGFLKLREAGFNRISIGMQSANDDELEFLGRIHTESDCELCVKNAREAGFENVSLDLMFGLPNQDMKSWRKSIEKAVSLNPNHLSCYGLKIEEGTPFADMNLNIDDDLSRDMYDECVRTLEANGYLRYEISNFAKSGYMSRHNMKYWMCDDFVGFGAGAYSCVSGVRFSNVKSTAEYMNRVGKVEERICLSDFDMMSEFVYLGLRLSDGISKTEFNKRFNVDINDIFGEQIYKNIRRGTIKDNGERLKIADKYFYVSNAILVDFI